MNQDDRVLSIVCCQSPENYSPVSNTPFLDAMLTFIVAKQIKGFLEVFWNHFSVSSLAFV